jgi:hypothetical protein
MPSSSSSSSVSLVAVGAARALVYPWRSVAAPQRATLTEETRAWAERFALAEDEALAKRLPVDIGGLAALTYPGAPREAQQLISDFLGWVFLQDDYFDEEDGARDVARLEQILRAFIAVLEGLDTPEDAPARVVSLAELRHRLQTLGGAWWFDRFASSMRRYWIDGVLAQAKLRAQGVTPDVMSYIDMRIEAVCVLPCLDLIEPAYGFTLTPDVVDDALLHEMRRAATFVVAVANDIFSYEKELRAGDPHNIVHLLVVNQGMTLEDAFASAVASHNDMVLRFDELVASLEEHGPFVRHYVEGHRRWMVGAYDWQLSSRRYSPRMHAERTW